MSLHYFSELLQDDEIKNWTISEIHGYYEKNIPAYRKTLYGQILANKDKLVLPSNLILGGDHYLPTNILAILELLKKDHDNFTFRISDEELREINKKYSLTLSENDMIMELRRTSLVGLIGKIKLQAISYCNRLENKAKNEMEKIPESADERYSEYDPKKIFIVHGRDETAKNELEKILRDKLKLEPIILMDKPNGGSTLIEKFENHTLNVGYVFVLLTPDDLGCLKDDLEQQNGMSEKISGILKPRARQNVILELGYFVGSLGRKRVCCIQKGIEDLLPSDLHGRYN